MGDRSIVGTIDQSIDRKGDRSIVGLVHLIDRSIVGAIDRSLVRSIDRWCHRLATWPGQFSMINFRVVTWPGQLTLTFMMWGHMACQLKRTFFSTALLCDFLCDQSFSWFDRSIVGSIDRSLVGLFDRLCDRFIVGAIDRLLVHLINRSIIGAIDPSLRRPIDRWCT